MGSRAALAIATFLTGCIGTADAPGDRTPVPEEPGAFARLDEHEAVDVDAAEAEWAAELEIYARGIAQQRLERHAFFAGNQLAEELLAREVNASLAVIGIDVQLQLTPTTPGHDRVTVLQGHVAPVGAPIASSCAFAEPIDDTATDGPSCRFLVAQSAEAATDRAVVVLARAQLPAEATAGALDPAEIEGQLVDAVFVGMDGVAADVVRTLRLNGVCDREAAIGELAFDRGTSIGRAAVVAAAAALREATPSSRCDAIDAIAVPARDNVRLDIDALVADHPLCDGYTAPDAAHAARYEASRIELVEGVEHGIDAGFAEVVTQLEQTWVCVPPPPAPPETHVATTPTAAPPPMMAPPTMTATPAPAPGETTPAPPPTAAVFDVCISNGCGGCIGVNGNVYADATLWLASSSYVCLDTAEWRAQNGLPCPGTGNRVTSRQTGTDLVSNVGRYALGSPYLAASYAEAIRFAGNL